MLLLLLRISVLLLRRSRGLLTRPRIVDASLPLLSVVIPRPRRPESSGLASPTVKAASGMVVGMPGTSVMKSPSSPGSVTSLIGALESCSSGRRRSPSPASHSRGRQAQVGRGRRDHHLRNQARLKLVTLLVICLNIYCNQSDLLQSLFPSLVLTRFASYPTTSCRGSSSSSLSSLEQLAWLQLLPALTCHRESR